MRTTFIRVATPLLAVFALAGAAAGQQSAPRVECVSPEDPKTNARCTLKVPKDPAVQRIVVRVEGAPPNTPVTFTIARPGEASLAILETVSTDRYGLAQISWTGSQADTGRIIRAQADVAGPLDPQREILVGAAPRTPTARELEPLARRVPVWYEERQLRREVGVRIQNPGSDCTENLVVFRPIGAGTASPDTVKPDTRNGACVATTHWRLGKGLGRQHLHAFLVDEPTNNRNLEAIARALPRVGGGLAGGRDGREYSVLKVQAETIQVTRRAVNQSGDSITIVEDSIINTSSIDRVEEQWFTAPTLGVDFPVFVSLERLRGSIAISLEHPDRDWFFGVSALQAMFGVATENLGVDLHLVGHVGRRAVVKDPDCGDDEDFEDCEDKEKILLLGFGIMTHVDGSGLLSTLSGIFK